MLDIISNLRPETMLTIMYNMFTKAIIAMINSHLQHWIINEKMFVEGRFILDAVISLVKILNM